jgi:hypothetical protein
MSARVGRRDSRNTSVRAGAVRCRALVVTLATMLATMLVTMLATVASVVGLPAANAGESTFPAPLLAPGAPVEGDNPAAIRAFYRDPASAVAEPLFLIELAAPVGDLPEGTRVSLLTGDPGGTRQRSSLYRDAAGPRGEMEQGGADGFTSVQPADVEITPEGLARIRLATVPDSDLVWAETETPEGVVATTPIFPLSQVTGASGPGALTAAEVATVRDGEDVATGEFVPLSAVPTLEIGIQDITVRTTQPVPTEVNGVPVTSVRDFLRIAPDVASSAETPYFVIIEYTENTIIFFDGTGGVPAEVPGREDWLVDDLSDDETLTSVTFDRGAFLAAVDLAPDAPVALGVSRAVLLEDGRYLQAEGPLGTLQWFDEAQAEPTPPTTDVAPTTSPLPTAVPDDEALEEDGADATVVLIAAGIAAVLAGIALYAARQNRKAYVNADVALGAMAKVVDKTAHEQDDEAETDADRVVRPARSGLRAPTPSPDVPPAEDPLPTDARPIDADRDDADREDADREHADREHADRDARWAAVGRKATEAGAGGAGGAGGAAEGAAARAGDQTDTASSDRGKPGAEEAPPALPGAGKSTRPDDALDALNRVIDDLHMPGES